MMLYNYCAGFDQDLKSLGVFDTDINPTFDESDNFYGGIRFILPKLNRSDKIIAVSIEIRFDQKNYKGKVKIDDFFGTRGFKTCEEGDKWIRNVLGRHLDDISEEPKMDIYHTSWDTVIIDKKYKVTGGPNFNLIFVSTAAIYEDDLC
tara:strand:- start:17240 stop:17683 length:444 start_codon:yes stop_codon:yes gene_type:complete